MKVKKHIMNRSYSLNPVCPKFILNYEYSEKSEFEIVEV